MAIRAVQLGRSHGQQSQYRQFIKNRTNRLERRAAKRDPESAPRKRRFNGYD